MGAVRVADASRLINDERLRHMNPPISLHRAVYTALKLKRGCLLKVNHSAKTPPLHLVCLLFLALTAVSALGMSGMIYTLLTDSVESLKSRLLEANQSSNNSAPNQVGNQANSYTSTSAWEKAGIADGYPW